MLLAGTLLLGQRFTDVVGLSVVQAGWRSAAASLSSQQGGTSERLVGRGCPAWTGVGFLHSSLLRNFLVATDCLPACKRKVETTQHHLGQNRAFGAKQEPGLPEPIPWLIHLPWSAHSCASQRAGACLSRPIGEVDVHPNETPMIAG